MLSEVLDRKIVLGNSLASISVTSVDDVHIVTLVLIGSIDFKLLIHFLLYGNNCRNQMNFNYVRSEIKYLIITTPEPQSHPVSQFHPPPHPHPNQSVPSVLTTVGKGASHQFPPPH